jgi:hypothetical protein
MISCNNDVETGGQDQNLRDDLIQVSPTINKITGLTRSPYVEETPNKVFSANIFISTTQGDYTSLWNKGTGETEAGWNQENAFGFMKDVKWPDVVDSGHKLYFSAISPKGSALLASGKGVEAKLDGKTDWMYANEVSVDSKEKVKLSFHHTQVLCKLYVHAEDSTAYRDWGAMKSIELDGVQYKDEASLDLPYDLLTVTFGTSPEFTLSGKKAALPLYGLTNKVPEGYEDTAAGGFVIPVDKEKSAGYVLIPTSNVTPATGADYTTLNQIRFKLTSDNYDDANTDKEQKAREALIDLSKAQNNQGGSAIYIRLTLQAKGRIQFDSTSIDGWGDVEDVPGTVG